MVEDFVVFTLVVWVDSGASLWRVSEGFLLVAATPDLDVFCGLDLEGVSNSDQCVINDDLEACVPRFGPCRRHQRALALSPTLRFCILYLRQQLASRLFD